MQLTRRQVRVYFGDLDAGMTEQLLNLVNVDADLNEPASEPIAAVSASPSSHR